MVNDFWIWKNPAIRPQPHLFYCTLNTQDLAELYTFTYSRELQNSWNAGFMGSESLAIQHRRGTSLFSFFSLLKIVVSTLFTPPHPTLIPPHLMVDLGMEGKEG
jgi:hypothetical protein